MTFDSLGLSDALLAQVRRQGYSAPTPIQTAAIPAVLGGGDVIGLAQTGTGKTAAFVLPLLQQLAQRPRGGIRALIVTPTRELAEQIHDTITTLRPQGGPRSATVYGGVGMGPQEQALRAGVDIIVACPGRLLDHIDRGYVRLAGVQTLVLDEADRLLDMGFLPAITRILRQLPEQRQTLLFSATMSPEIVALTARATRSPQTIQVDRVAPATLVTHAIYPVQEQGKTPLLLELLRSAESGSVLVFTRTKHRADRVAQRLERSGYSVARLHSNRSQNQRQAALDGFRDGTFRVLVATDIAARGIDVSRVSHVINFDMPDTAEAYIHRIGRTGRAARTGDAFTLVTPDDVSMVHVIERTIGTPIERRSISGLTDAMPLPAHTSQPRVRQPAVAGRSGQRGHQGQPQQRRPEPVRAEPAARPTRSEARPEPAARPTRPEPVAQAARPERRPEPAARSPRPAEPRRDQRPRGQRENS
ncbi:MAG TPA: DEAD/DEAH box helicase [Roseiflexaceae bacterium]|nr:DEAD/DEAH box helicase [Roseiflexaceae bacterium]